MSSLKKLNTTQEYNYLVVGADEEESRINARLATLKEEKSQVSNQMRWSKRHARET